MTLEPGQFKIVTGIDLEIRPEVTRIDVTYDPVQVATEQLKAEEHQRVLGFIPNFYVSYEKNPAPVGHQNAIPQKNQRVQLGFILGERCRSSKIKQWFRLPSR